MHGQLPRMERRPGVQPGGAFRQPQHVGVEARRTEGRGEERRGGGGCKAWPEKRGRHDVAQAQPGSGAHTTGAFEAADVEQRVIAEELRQPQKMQHVEMEPQEVCVCVHRCRGQVIA
jgi:hypothetical protein